MASRPEARPTFSAVVEELSSLLHACEAGEGQPQEEFAVYQDWNDSNGAIPPSNSTYQAF